MMTMRSTRRAAMLGLRLCLTLMALGAWHTWADGNLLPNPDFDTDLGGWTASSGVCEHLDSGWPTGVDTPGSARCVNTNAGASIGTTLTSPCVAVEPQTWLLASRYVFIPTGQATTGQVSLTVKYYSGASCLTDSGAAAAAVTSMPGDLWQQAQGWSLSPMGTNSMKLVVRVTKDQAGGSFEARVDGVYLGRQAKGDFNQDGRADLLFDDLASDQHLVWFMGREHQASTGSLSPGGPGMGWKLSATDDFDGDRRTDVVFRNPTTGATQFWMLNGLVAKPAKPLLASPPSTDWELAAAADFNHDQKSDLLWRNTVTQKLQVWTLNGTTHLDTLVPVPDQAVNANWACVAALDINKDGNPDLLWYNATTGKIVYWLMDSDLVRTAGDFTSPSNAGNNNWKVVAAADYARRPNALLDSVDIVWRNETSGSLVMWYMNSSGVRVDGVFTTPTGPMPALGWNVLGPR